MKMFRARLSIFLWLADDSNVGFLKTTIEIGGELQDAPSYYETVKPTIELENVTCLGTDDPPVMRACRKLMRLFVYFN